ncbi:MAG: phosphoribosylformylglycinamidine synthase subunit PurS [Chloroflexi bacterium]|nr:phosphoribosylformylglycinamidine synthase subunit PurS [Chloroflexota bacterium]
MLKPIVNDPQGEAILGALRSLQFGEVNQVRAGKYFEIQLDVPNRAAAERHADDMCRKLLANPVIEDYRIQIEDVSTPRDTV